MRADFYKAAVDAQKTYDNFSLLVLAGIFAITAFSFTAMVQVWAAMPPTTVTGELAYRWGVTFFGSVSILLLMFVYWRLSFFATVARNVAAAIERGEFDKGVQHVYSNLKEYKQQFWPDKKKSIRFPPSIYTSANWIAVFQILALTLAPLFMK